MECFKISDKSNELICLKIIKRPSSIIKSPYVADCVILEDDRKKPFIEDNCEDEIKEKYLLHTPGLGCGGLVIPDKYTYAIKKSSSSSKTHFTAIMSYNEDSDGIYYVGIHKINGKKFYVEVKNAMVSYEEKKPRYVRRAIFPEASKRTLIPISERALKHANTLKELINNEDTFQTMLLYTVPRIDCQGGVLINPNDISYSKAVFEAKESGVILQGISFKFDLTGVVKFIKELNVYLED